MEVLNVSKHFIFYIFQDSHPQVCCADVRLKHS